MTMTMNTPLKNCFQKFCFDTQSSNTKTRDIPLSAMAVTASPALMPSWRTTMTSISTSAPNRQAVCSESVHTSVRMPPFRV